MVAGAQEAARNARIAVSIVDAIGDRVAFGRIDAGAARSLDGGLNDVLVAEACHFSSPAAPIGAPLQSPFAHAVRA
jgi:hypothetical protein